MTKLMKKEIINSTFCPTIYYYSEIGSTNSIARKIITEKQELGFVVLSEVQTGGYGQRDNFWESPLGGLWCSIGIKPEIKISSLSLIPILTALSVAIALDLYKLKTKLKWPNDILHSSSNRKIGGILVEGKVSQHSLEYLIIGIGLNINNTLDQYSPSLRNKITTTFEILNEKIPLKDILLEIINQIEYKLITIREGGELKILSEWKKWDNILGLNVKMISNNIEYHGIAKDILRNGQLLLELKDGRTIKFSSGHLVLSH
ncbi:MAG: biotin--[acetyl-CoA-carboxylase] ligase [Candidatus Hodarchaeales archaeon]